jgi:pilus assembly protein CpaF
MNDGRQVFGRRAEKRIFSVAPGAPAVSMPESVMASPTSTLTTEAPPKGKTRLDMSPDSDVGKLRTQCMMRIDATTAVAQTRANLLISLARTVQEVASEMRLAITKDEELQIATDLADDMIGLGPLQALLDDDSINDIMVNGPNRIFVERRGVVMEMAHLRFRDDDHLVNTCQRIATTVGRRVDESSPLVDARLKDGSRVNIVLPPVAIDGASLSIRKFRHKPIVLANLVEYGSINEPIARLLALIAYCKYNVIISGGTGSGKTTLMNAISRHIDPAERIVTVEDAAELRLQQPHVVRLETRPPSLEGKGEITQRDLVKNALRMRPDRIIIGEVRGAEAFDMLQAMNTGHDGSMSTVHANNARDAISRIENMVQMSNSGLSLEAVRQQIVSAVNIIVQIQRQRDGTRRLVQLVEVTGMESGTPLLSEVVRFVHDGETPDGKIKGHYKVMPIRSAFDERLSYFQKDKAWMEILQEAARG